jgi:hypothetical protein
MRPREGGSSVEAAASNQYYIYVFIYKTHHVEQDFDRAVD